MKSSYSIRERSNLIRDVIPTVAIGLSLGIGTGILGYHLLRSHVVRLITAVKVTPHASPGAQPPNAKGPDLAPVEIEEFSDFQCPPCRSLYKKLKSVEGKYSSQLKVIYRNYPIASLHKNAFEAACAAEAAGLQGHFWEMHDRLFDNQEAWASSSDAQSLFVEYARSLNLDVARFQQDLTGALTKQRVQADQRRGDSIGVPGTPIVLINGVQVPPTAITDAGLRAAVEKGLNGRPGCSDGCRAN
jgi:protein-disulfide isomerase